MTVKAVILGLLGAVLIAGTGYLNDGHLRNTFLVGNHLPISVFGFLIVMVVAINPLLGWLRLRFRPAELAVSLTLMLAACAIPGSGLMRTFTTTLAVPLNYARIRPDWTTHRVLSYVPPEMLPDASADEALVLDGYLNGLSDGKSMIPLGRVPWSAWRGPLSVWMPLVMLLSVSIICLSLIVHRQWSQREHLRYPIADFAAGLMGADEQGGAPVYRRRIFWIGLGMVLGIHLVNGLQQWEVIRLRIPMHYQFWQVVWTFTSLGKDPRIHHHMNLWIIPTVVGIGFMLPSQVSFSLGIAPTLLLAVTAALMSAGVDMSEGYMQGGVLPWQRFGSYLGIGVLIAYTGRSYYRAVLAEAATFRRRPSADAPAVWACRILIVAVAAMVAILTALGLDWTLAILAVGMILMLFVVMARLSAESGLFFCQPWWQPMGVFVGLFGLAALGPRTAIILALLSAMLTIDPRECLMPFLVNGLKVCERLKVRPGRVAVASGGVFAVALAVAVVVALWANYNYGMFSRDKWAAENVPDMTFKVVEDSVSKMTERQLDAAAAMGPLDRLAAMRPNRAFLWSAGIGLALVGVMSVLRLRYARFPLHPLIFLVWGTYPVGVFHYSFLMGWMIKAVVVKYGGGRQTHDRARRFMFGVIAGDLLGGLIFMVAGAVYYGYTGYFPPEYRVFPG